MSTFPPIADYGFLSDCENNCLVAPDGSIEWLSLPRPDSPSVFGALLDRNAGSFRLGPFNTLVPDHRRYIPGTMVLETTWHTPTGWLVVNDMFVVRPVSDEGRRAGYERVPRVGAGVGTILRTATCISGKVDVVAMCLPMFDYGSTPSAWSYDADSYHSMAVRQPDGDVALRLHSSFQLGEVGARAYVRSALNEGESGFIALTWSGPALTTQQEADADLESTVKFWRDWLGTGLFQTTRGGRSSSAAR